MSVSPLERGLLAADFLTRQLSSKERVLVAAFSLGFNTSQVARRLQVSVPAVSRMAHRIRRKAEKYWA